MTFSNKCDPSQLFITSSARMFSAKVVDDNDSFNFLFDLTATKPEFSNTLTRSLNSGFDTGSSPFDLQI